MARKAAIHEGAGEGAGESAGMDAAETPYLFPPAEFRENDYVRVYRRDDVSKQWINQFRLGSDEQTEDQIKELRGGGRYRVQHIGTDDETGKSKIMRQREVALDGPPKQLVRDPWEERKARANGAPAPVAVAPRGASGGNGDRVTIDDALTAGIVNLLKASNDASAAQMEAMRSLIESARGGDKGGDKDLILELMKSAAEDRRMFMQMMMDRKKDADPLDLIEKVGAILKPNGPEHDMAARMVGMVSDVLDIKDRLSGTREAEDPLMAMARENLPRLIGVLENAGRRDPATARELAALRGAAAPAKIPPPAPVVDKAPGSLAGAAQPEPSTKDGPVWWLALSRRVPYFVALAEKEKDPVLMAMAEVELLTGTPQEAPLREFLTADESVDQVLSMAPTLKPHEEWTRVFLMQVRESLGILPEGTVEQFLTDVEAAAEEATRPKLVQDPVEDSIPGQNE